MNKKTDLELTEICAKWLGLPEHGFMGESLMYVKDNTFTPFDPLHNQNDLWNLVMPKLEEEKTVIFSSSFYIYRNANLIKAGIPADLPRAILEMVAELYESEVKG